jgi:hypothetical protein
MAARDYRTETYNKIVALLKAHAGFFDATGADKTKVREGNFISFVNGKWSPEKQTKGDESFPEAKLELTDLHDTGFTQTQSYAYYSGSFNPRVGAWNRERRFGYALVITHKAQRINDNDVLEEEALNALLIGGPRLGLDFLFAWGPVVGRTTNGYTSEAAGTIRSETRLEIPTIIRVHGNIALAAEAPIP